MNNETTYDKYWNSKGEYGQERVRRKNLRKKKRLDKLNTCPKCHRSNKGPIELLKNPYYWDMNNTVVWERMCRDCYDDACGDI